MSLLLLALVPSLLLLFYYYHRDRHPEPWGWVGFVFVLGALACLLVHPLQRLLQGWLPPPHGPGWQLFLECLLIPGMVEETIKLLVVVAAIWWRRDFDEPMDGLVYGIAAALGFTFGEDLYQHWTLGVDWGRVLTTAAHPWFSAFWAASLGWARVLPRRQGLGLVLLGLTASILVHALFDFLILGADSATGWTWLRHLLVPLLVGLYWLTEQMLEGAQRPQASRTS